MRIPPRNYASLLEVIPSIRQVTRWHTYCIKSYVNRSTARVTSYPQNKSKTSFNSDLDTVSDELTNHKTQPRPRSSPASFAVTLLGDLVKDAIELGSKPPPLTRIAVIGLGTRLH